MVVDVDRHLAQHMAVAIRQHRNALAAAGYPRPAGLADLEAAFLRVAKGGHTGPDGGEEREAVDAVAYRRPHELLTQKQAAAMLGMSPSTVKRMLNRGELTPVVVGGRRRVARDELERFTTRRRNGGGRLLSAHERPAAGIRRPAAGAPNSTEA